MNPLAALACALPLLAAALAAQAQGVSLAGSMGSKAVLVIDGQPATLAVGDSVRGVRLMRLDAGEAQVERGGVSSTLRLGAAPTALVGSARGATAAASEIVIPAGPGGHFVTSGSINNRPVRFMVDTGATTVALSRAEADRIGLDLSGAQRGTSQTAGGTVTVLALTLSSIRVGEVEVSNVPAIVVPNDLPNVLLGNSFLQRFQMRRENDVMRLEPRR